MLSLEIVDIPPKIVDSRPEVYYALEKICIPKIRRWSLIWPTPTYIKYTCIYYSSRWWAASRPPAGCGPLVPRGSQAELPAIRQHGRSGNAEGENSTNVAAVDSSAPARSPRIFIFSYTVPKISDVCSIYHMKAENLLYTMVMS